MYNVKNETFENENGLMNCAKRYRRRYQEKETQHKKHVNWRRNKTLTLLTQGCSTYEIAEVLKVSQSTAARDVQWLRKEAEQELKVHIQSLPHEYNIAYRGLSECLKYAWGTLLAGEDPRNRAAILSLITNIYKQRIDMATNAGVIEKSLEYVDQARKEVVVELRKNED